MCHVIFPYERGLQTAAGASVVTEAPFGFGELADAGTFGQGMGRVEGLLSEDFGFVALVEESLTSTNAAADCHDATEAVGSDTVEAFGRDAVEPVWTGVVATETRY